MDRGHRELPIKIDYVGKNIPTQPTDKVVFHAEQLPSSNATGATGATGSAGRDAGDEEFTVGELELVVRSDSETLEGPE